MGGAWGLFCRRPRRGPCRVGVGLGLALLAARVLSGNLLLLPGDLGRALLVDPRFFDKPVGCELLGIDLLLRFDPSGIRLAVAFGLFAGDLGRLRRAPDLDFTLLLQPRIFLIAADLERALARLAVLGCLLYPSPSPPD